jgi:hypothetical protein
MNTRGAATLDRAYDMLGNSLTSDDPRSAIREMPVQTGSTKSLSAQWWASWESQASAELAARSDGLLEGRVVNPLPIPLTECMVYYDTWAYRVESSLPPGGSASLGSRPLDLEWRLTRRRLVAANSVSSPWDQTTLDAPRILEILMFYQAAGGRNYTQLAHRYHGRLDLSDHLRSGRAVLVGRGETPASQLLRDGESLEGQCEQRWSFYRIVFPVERTDE